jgi:serine protease Do
MKRWIIGAIAPLAVVAVAIAIPVFAQLKSSPAPFWSEQPVASAVPAPPPSPWVQLARELKPAVVNVSTKRVEEARSLGSAFVVNADGYVVTNNHVVDGATEIKVTLADGREMAAKVLGRDAKTDLALLKIDAKGLPSIALADSTELQVGEPVMAIGNPFGLQQTVTTGIVSATGRVIGGGPYDDFIQTDASINPGNSGGPLINSKGQAVGINTALVSQTGGSVGIGFAIPINLAKSVLTQLATAGRVERGYLGVAVQRITTDLARSFKLDGRQGALVASVAPGSPAMRGGVKSGDVIVEVDRQPVKTVDDLERAVEKRHPGSSTLLLVHRDKGDLYIALGS